MIIAHSLEESEAFIEQEESHILRLDVKPKLYHSSGHSYLIDAERERLVYFPPVVVERKINTRKYGTLKLVSSISELLSSRFNKGVLAVYCGRTYTKQTKRTALRVVCLSTEDESFEFEEREFSNSGGVYLNSVEDIEPMNAFLIVIERNRYANNGCVIINSSKLKGNG
jgi:hypothetical protein